MVCIGLGIIRMDRLHRVVLLRKLDIYALTSIYIIGVDSGVDFRRV